MLSKTEKSKGSFGKVYRKPCQQCTSCLEIENNNHPDFMQIQPDGNSVKIEQIRFLQQKITEKPIISKNKVYIINNAEFPSALNRYREFHVPQKLDFESMEKAIKYFEGTHDFKGFKSSGGSPKKTTVRTLTKCKIQREDNRIIIELSGDGFLYNMVRIISGTIVDVGLGKIKAEDIEKIIEAGDRTLAGRTLPPHGLYLMEVRYN